MAEINSTITIVFDSHVVKVSDGSLEWTESGQSRFTQYQTGTKTMYVTLESGYVVDTVVSSDFTILPSHTDNTFSFSVPSSGDIAVTFTITSKAKQTIDINNQYGVRLKTAGKYCENDYIVRPLLEKREVTSNGTITPFINKCGFSEVTVNVQPTLQTKTVTPTKSAQTITPDSAYDGLSSVRVDAIPSNYIIPSGSQNITANGTYDVTEKASVVVNVDTAKPEQTKTVDLAMASGNQVVTPDSGKVLTQVTINKPSTLVAGNIKSGVSIGGVTGTLEAAKEEQTKTIEITSNGTTKITADSGKVLSEVTVTVNVPSEQPALNAPTISLSDSTLTITNPATNGNFATAYKVYDGETLVATVTTTTVDLSAYITTAGTHTITVKAAGTNFVDSAASNSVTVSKAGASYNVTVGSNDSANQGFYVYDGTSTAGTLLATIDSAETKTVVCTTGFLYLDSKYGAPRQSVTLTGGITEVSTELFKVTGDGTITTAFFCIIEGTQITLADGSTKAIEDITYNDELLVWNFYDGKFDTAKPSWIKVPGTVNKYCLVKFSNGAEVGFVGPGEHTRQCDGGRGYHRIFNKEAGAFTYVGTEETPIGTTTFADDNSFPTVVSEEVVEKEVKFYNITTEKHFNIFANGILTSCRLSNMYRIENMKYVGERLITDEQVKKYFDERKAAMKHA